MPVLILRPQSNAQVQSPFNVNIQYTANSTSATLTCAVVGANPPSQSTTVSGSGQWTAGPFSMGQGITTITATLDPPLETNIAINVHVF